MFDDLLFSKSRERVISNCSTCVLPFIWWQVDLPTGGKLSSCGLQLLGLSGLGSSGGFERLYHLYGFLPLIDFILHIIDKLLENLMPKKLQARDSVGPRDCAWVPKET